MLRHDLVICFLLTRVAGRLALRRHIAPQAQQQRLGRRLEGRPFHDNLASISAKAAAFELYGAVLRPRPRASGQDICAVVGVYKVGKGLAHSLVAPAQYVPASAAHTLQLPVRINGANKDRCVVEDIRQQAEVSANAHAVSAKYT
ncbi:hypothetical protein BEN49_00290 [Hymenobacter coccineus]|uniref:Uncharacterized protein n=1 Tax=Hymenobacter coccineus TaxID=1908235 RepID=A0A1G1TIS5_9BACT|nr:hypothetical protein BEN49_00290 [Hymenobacter coccineus]